jgi:hypothetical protein
MTDKEAGEHFVVVVAIGLACFGFGCIVHAAASGRWISLAIGAVCWIAARELVR